MTPIFLLFAGLCIGWIYGAILDGEEAMTRDNVISALLILSIATALTFLWVELLKGWAA